MLSIRNGFQNVASLILLILLVSWDKIEEPKISSKTAKKENVSNFYYCWISYTFIVFKKGINVTEAELGSHNTAAYTFG